MVDGRKVVTVWIVVQVRACVVVRLVVVISDIACSDIGRSIMLAIWQLMNSSSSSHGNNWGFHEL